MERKVKRKMYNLIFVDDETRVLEVIKNMLPWEDMNIRIVGCCDNAISALEIMINEHVDILVTDIKMPVMNGIELISRAKEMYSNIECLVLSGYEEFELARLAMEQGVSGYLLKPCTKEVLKKEIEKSVEKMKRKTIEGITNFEIRQKRVEKIYDELMKVPIEYNEDDYVIVQNIADRCNDYSAFKESVIMIAIHHSEFLKNFPSQIKYMTKIFDREELMRHAVEILRSIKGRPDISDPIVLKMVDYVYEHYDIAKLTLQYVADNSIHFSARYIGKRFTKEMGIKFSEFLLKVRMEKAIEILYENDYINADEIANRIGLGNNVQYFYRLFRQYTGMTIKEYREKNVKK